MSPIRDSCSRSKREVEPAKWRHCRSATTRWTLDRLLWCEMRRGLASQPSLRLKVSGENSLIPNVEGQTRHGRKNLPYRCELERPTGCLSKTPRITHNFLVRV